MCNAPKFGEVEERTGYGGGYNDRGVVEYKERKNEDDDEYDEFGRRRKKRKLGNRNSDDEDSDRSIRYVSPPRSKPKIDVKKPELVKVLERKEDEDVITKNLNVFQSQMHLCIYYPLPRSRTKTRKTTTTVTCPSTT